MNTTIEKKEKREKRRGKGEGSIICRDGRWVGIVTIGYKENGKRNRRWVYGKTQREVTEEMTRLRGQKLAGTLTGDSKMKVSEWLAHWLANIAPYGAKPCRQTTLAGYEKMIRLHINPIIAGKSLSKLTSADVELIHAEMRRAEKSQGTIRIVHGILRRALKVAIDKGILAVNVCDKAGRPGASAKEMSVLTAEQAAAFLKAAESDRLHAMYVVAITGGLRQGELFGLKREDIDLQAGTLNVRRTLVWCKGEFIENPPKSKAGSRQINMSEMAVKAIRDHYRRMMAEGNAGAAYVFCNREGGPLWASCVRRKSMHPILTKAGLPKIRFHDLRHTSATMMMANGVNPKIVQERLGHSNVSITLGTYSHSMPGMDRAAAATFDVSLASKKIG